MKLNRPLLAAGIVSVAVACVLRVRPASIWLQALTPDGALNPETAAFVDKCGWLVGLAGLVLGCAAVSSRFRDALAAAWSAPRTSRGTETRWLAPLVAAIAFLARLAAARFGDIGLGDDGARVVWLQEWLRDPHPVWSGLWLPAHLYLHALFNLVVRDPVWSGVLLSASAAAATVWILARRFEAVWGTQAAAIGACGAALLPVSVAYGGNPDVNPVFAFFVVAAVAAMERAARSGSDRWLVVGWVFLVTASWMRFDSLLLVPAVALLLWPRRRAALLFASTGILPLLLWNVADSVLSGRTARVVGVLASDPSLAGSLVSHVFSFVGGVWQAFTLPVLVFGAVGMIRAWRARAGRSWMWIGLVHFATLAGMTLVLHAGTQARYFILAATLFAAYAGVALAAILERWRVAGVAMLVLAGLLFAVTPAWYPGPGHLWVRREPRLRALVDEVAQSGAGQDVVWVADESAYFYACRKKPPVDRYHAMPRADSDPKALLAELQGARRAVACVQQAPMPLDRWGRFLAIAANGWHVEEQAARGDYRIYILERATPPDRVP